MQRYIIIALCLYLIYIWVLKPFFRNMLFNMVKKAAENQFGTPDNQKQQSRKPEGSIHIDYIPEKDKKGPQKGYTEGEYIDYEEVK